MDLFTTLRTQFSGTICPIVMKFIHIKEGICKAYIPSFKQFEFLTKV